MERKVLNPKTGRYNTKWFCENCGKECWYGFHLCGKCKGKSISETKRKNRIPIETDKLCEYGCGREARHRFKNGKWCCSKSQNSCSEIKRVNSRLVKKYHKKIGMNEEWKNKIKIARSFQDPPIPKGTIFSENHRRKISESLIGNFPSEETRRKMSKARKGKTYEEIYGKEKAKELKKKKSEKSKIIAKKIWKKLSDKEKEKRIRKAIKNLVPKIPNNFEQDFNNLTPPNLRFVGNGSFWITFPDNTHKNPDFKVKGQKKLIELFGEYWHPLTDEQDYVNKYKKIGYECLVVWYKDWVNNKKRVLERVNRWL